MWSHDDARARVDFQLTFSLILSVETESDGMPKMTTVFRYERQSHNQLGEDVRGV